MKEQPGETLNNNNYKGDQHYQIKIYYKSFIIKTCSTVPMQTNNSKEWATKTRTGLKLKTC